MSDDLLERAARALRDEGEPSAEDLRRARARLLDARRARARDRRRRIAWTLPIAAVLVAGTAWAAKTGRFEAFVRGLSAPEEVPAEVSQRPEQGSAHTTSPVPAPEETPARPDPEEETTVVPETAIAERPVERPRAMPSGAVSAGPPPAAPPVDGAVSAEELARYRAAHRAHFVDQDSARAIVAWDAYLAAHPNGNFAIEARYNRAIALIRVGRSAEARAALAPFASGSVAGGYRAKEARTLLDALDRTNPRPTDPRPTDAEPSDARPVVF